MISFITIAALSALSTGVSPDSQSDQQCLIVRYAPDGTRSERIGDPSEFGVRLERSSGRGRSTGAVVRSNSGGSVSASSSTRVSGSSSTATADDGDRAVSVHTNESGCTVVVDERPARRSQR